MQEEKGKVVGKIISGILTITVILMLIGLIVLGFVGLVKVWIYLDLVKLIGERTLFSNVLYLGALLFVIYIIILIIEMIVKFGIKFLNVAQSLAKTILVYAVQFVLGTFAIKLLIDNIFHRIEVSLFVVCVSAALFYVIVFFSSGAHKGKDNLWDV